MQKVLSFVLIMAMTIQVNAQDLTERGFNTKPDNVYGILVGILIAFGVGACGLFVWVFGVLLKRFTAYSGSRENASTKQIQLLKELNESVLGLTKEVTGQGAKITEIESKVTDIEKELTEIKYDVSALKSK